MATTTESSSDGPVLSVVSKRIRALRKKYNRIIQMEEALANGKTLNKEQEEVLRSKPVVTALIDELEKLRSPLASALAEEMEQSTNERPKQSDRSINQDELIEDLVRLVYFGSLFDVRSQAEFTAMMLTRSHERGCCLTYDYVTDDAVDLLSEKDLNLISVLGSLVTSRPVDEVISHKSALEACINHAKQWLSCSDQPINPEATATYAGLKEKLKKIISSDFFTATPEMKAPVEVAAAVGQLHISEGSNVPSETVEGDVTTPDNKEEQENPQSSESYNEHQSVAPEEPAKMDEVEEATARDLPPVQSEQQDLEETDMVDQAHADSAPKDQQATVGNRRSYPNGRGGGRGGGGRRPYPNGRGGGGRGNGGRGGGGGYSNGGRGYYHDSNYQPRGYYNNRGGRGGGGRSVGGGGGGGGGSVYNRGGGSNGGYAATS